MTKGRFFWTISALLIIGILIILGYSDRDVEISPSYQTSSMKNLHLTHKEDKKVNWELTAQNAIFPMGKKEVLLESIGLKIKQSPEILLTSGSGVYEVDKQNVTLNKPVEILIKDTVFSTNTLKWNSKDELISTKDDVKFRGNNFLVEGTGLTAKVNKQKVTIQNNVKAIYYR